MQYERRWLAVVAIGLSLFLSALDATIVALALPPIAHHFQLSDSLVSVVTLSYVIPLTVLILPAGDLIGRFRVLPSFLVAVLGFGLGSIICGLAASFPVLVLGRVMQGCFAAVIATQGIATAAAVVSPGERGRAMGIVGALAPLGGVAGPGIGGLLLGSFGWSSVFFVNVPVCLLAALLGLFSLRGVRLGGWQSGGAYREMAGWLRRPSFLWGLPAFVWTVCVAGARETMGAASALSNLVSRLGSVCGPLALGITWTFLASFSAQIGVGILVIDGFAVLNLLFAWLLVQRSQDVSPEEAPEAASRERGHAEAL